MLQALYYFEVILPKTGIFNEDPLKSKLMDLIDKTYELINFFGFLLEGSGTNEQNEVILNVVESTLNYYSEVEEISNMEMTDEFMQFVKEHDS